MAIHDSTFIPLTPEIFNENNELTNLKNYILRQLGWPLIRVEITPDQLMDCIIDATTMYHNYAALDYDIRVCTVQGNQVPVPEDIMAKHIVDILFQRDYFDSMSAGLGMMGYEFTLGGVLPFNMSGRSPLVEHFDLAQYYLYLQHMEDFKKLLGITRHFEIMGGTIHLYPASQTYSRIGILYKPMMDEKNIESTMWIKKYSTARAKVIVGNIRSKLSSFSSTGANISADGENLRSEGREEITKLEEDLQFMGIPMPIMQG